MKLKKSKRIISMVIALLLLNLSFLGCNGSKNTSTINSINGNQSNSTNSKTGREKINGVMYKTGLPIVDPGTYTFTLFVDDSKEGDDYPILDIFEKQTGIKVKLMKYPYDVAQEKLNLQLNSDSYADCIGGWTLQANDILTHGMDEGIYIPLENYFKEYCPKINEILSIKGVRDTMTAPDGHIYSIPYVLGAPKVPWLPYINTKWLKNVGMEMPKTTEEFKKVLEAFKAKDANGNGDPDDEIPFSANPDNKSLGLLCGWFGISVCDELNGQDNGFTMVGNKLTFGANTNQFKSGMKYLAGLWKEGLIDKELFTQDVSQFKAKGGKDLFGCAITFGSGDFMPYKAGEKPNWDPLPVLKGSNNEKPVYLRDTYGTSVLKNQVVITDKAKNPEAICRWWDNVYQLDNSLQTQNGPLNITLFKTKDGQYTHIDNEKLSKADQDKYSWSNLYPQSLPKYIPANFKIKQTPEPYDEKGPADKLYEPYLTEMIPDVWVPVDKASRYADLSTAISNYIRQKEAEWISGQTDIDTDWNSYLDQLKKLHLDELIQIKQEAMESRK